MEIFISWSGTLSLKIATNLRDWLQDVLPGIEVFVSAEDVDKGAAWFPAIRGHLAKSEVGVVCLTRGNIASNWLHYEAGALARGLERDRICCFLVDVLPTELSSPLREFQATCFTKEDITRLVRTIHQRLDKHICESDERLRKHVDRFWPDIDRSVREALASSHPKDDAETFDNELLCAVIDRELAAGRIEEVFHWLDRAKVNRSFSCLGTLQFIEGALARIVGHRMASSKLRAAIAHTGGYDFATFELALLHCKRVANRI
jgi:TIR domain